jgi:hypothetical protein
MTAYSARHLLETATVNAITRAWDATPEPVEVDAADLLPTPRVLVGDHITYEGHECYVKLIGWWFNGVHLPSPYHGDDVWRAYIVSRTWQEGDHYTEWVALHELTDTAQAPLPQWEEPTCGLVLGKAV